MDRYELVDKVVKEIAKEKGIHEGDVGTYDTLMKIADIAVGNTFPDYDEIEKAANKNADRFYMMGDEVSWYATQHGFQDGVEWLQNELTKSKDEK